MRGRVLTLDIETTGLDAGTDSIICIGYIDEDREGRSERDVIGWDEQTRKFRDDERGILADFWNRLRSFRSGADRIVGHNVFDFDLKFIYQRSVICGVPPTVELSFARYRNQPIFDTMCEWEKWSFRSRISLDSLAKALGLPSSKDGGIDGSRVREFLERGEHQMIRDYCMLDVELTRAIYRRMVFADCVSVHSNALARPAFSREVSLAV